MVSTDRSTLPTGQEAIDTSNVTPVSMQYHKDWKSEKPLSGGFRITHWGCQLGIGDLGLSTAISYFSHSTISQIAISHKIIIMRMQSGVLNRSVSLDLLHHIGCDRVERTLRRLICRRFHAHGGRTSTIASRSHPESRHAFEVRLHPRMGGGAPQLYLACMRWRMARGTHRRLDVH